MLNEIEHHHREMQQRQIDLAGRGKMLSNREFLGIYRLESNA
jgi:hypothetical protein